MRDYENLDIKISATIYFDTSAYLEILLGGPKAKGLLKILGHKTLCSSTLLIFEAERNRVRLSREKKLGPDACITAIRQLKEEIETFILKEVDLELFFMGRFPPVLLPKTSDLIHLRTALWFMEKEGLDLFLTLDLDQMRAAIEIDLPVDGIH